ncbi:MAG: putative DNA-binding domain-containing protein [Proteobacteria bacterium]|nr:putative DNA-binding domain-containing protein [Pseudomonadota bacterium]
MLKQIQTEFQDYLIHHDLQILPQIAADERFSASKRLKVYFDAYRIRLKEILKLDFPKTATLLGDEAFDTAFEQYLYQYPSQHFSVRYFGQFFSEFLNNHKPFSDHNVFSQMALFEWSISYTIDAKDGELVTQKMLSQLAPEIWADLHFYFHPSVTSQVFTWDIPQLWQDIENEQPPRQPIAQPQPTRWLLWRKGLRSLFQSCTIAQERMVLAVLAGKSFADICEDLMDILPEEDIPITAAQTLFKWVNEDMIAKIA